MEEKEIKEEKKENKAVSLKRTKNVSKKNQVIS